MNTGQALKDYGQTSGDFGGSVDAFDAITRTALTQNYNVAVGGRYGKWKISSFCWLPGSGRSD